ENVDKLHDVAKALLEKEKLTAEEFNAIMDGKTLEEFQAEKELNQLKDAANKTKNESEMVDKDNSEEKFNDWNIESINQDEISTDVVSGEESNIKDADEDNSSKEV
ncbi:MAG: hypothetical protein RR128_09735, partial [Clostridium sp.]